MPEEAIEMSKPPGAHSRRERRGAMVLISGPKVRPIVNFNSCPTCPRRDEPEGGALIPAQDEPGA
jgi:hypothetical protein